MLTLILVYTANSEALLRETLRKELETKWQVNFLPGGSINFYEVQKNVSKNEEKSKMLSDSCACYKCLVYLPEYLFLIELFKILFDYCLSVFLGDFFGLLFCMRQ